jgi:hypothetical protein
MTFRIERVGGVRSEIVLRVCGRVHIECVNTLKEPIETESAKTVLDLSEVTLAVRSIDIVTALELSVSGRLTNAKAEDRALRRRNSSAVRSGIQRRARPLGWPIESWPKAINSGGLGLPTFCQ